MPVKVNYKKRNSEDSRLTEHQIAEFLEAESALVFTFQDYLFTNQKDSEGRILVFDMRDDLLYFLDNSYYEMAEFLFDHIAVKRSDFCHVESYEITIKG